MRVILLLTIGCFGVLQTTTEQMVPYDCRRLNSQCLVGLCQSADGTCNCNGGSPSIPGFEGFDCRLKTDEINTGGCTGFGGCSAGSTCYTRGGEDFCYCSATHTGQKCDQKRVDVSVCNETHFGLYIKPHTDGLFAGVISIIKEEPFDRVTILTTDGCVGVKQSDQSYQILTTTDTTIGGTNPCSEALQKSNIPGGEQFVYKVRVTYLQTTTTQFDETHTLTCQVATGETPTWPSTGNTTQPSVSTTSTPVPPVTQAMVPYDCRRLNSQCGVGLCQSTDGACDCNGGSPAIPGFQGFDCRLKTDEINPGGCTGFGGCSAGSTCYTRGGEDFCYCSATHTGQKCDQKRVDVSVCNATHFGLYIKPHTDGLFAGVISIIKELPFGQEEMLTRDGCVGVKQSDQSYQILTTTDTTIGGTNPCFDALQKSSTNGGEQFVYKVRVTYHPGVGTAFDETHTFTCEVAIETPTWPSTGNTTQSSVTTTSTPPNVIPASPVPTGTTNVGKITTQSLLRDTDKSPLIGGLLGAAVAFLIIIIFIIVLICRRKARSNGGDNSKDCFDFCKKKKQPDLNEVSYTPAEK